MRLVSFLTGGQPSYGVAEGNGLREAAAGFRSRYPDLRAVLTANAVAELGRSLDRRFGIDAVTLLPPVPNPDKILCVGLNYLSHIRETGREAPRHPSIFVRFPSSVRGHGVPLIRPRVSAQFDFEGELAVVIGRPGRRIAAADAMDHVAGYSAFNDGSIRDFQRHTTQFWPGKSFDDSGSMGPWLVTRDDLPDPAAQHLRTLLNGEVMQSAPLSDLAFTIPDIIAYVSQVTELLPGDIIATGTPGGVGLFREPPVFMRPGDRIEVEITGIGTLSNPVADEI
ncbi:fumarylacetoacetate hydrolase family protein [Ruixingdingia sedimenti]|uniref:Fumarylacetoacetate hydrolase family protein n=1 Tax=Ruixingdingia sedimenti TaxID=3073604 RepID=A0ABU1FD87_9RHOB|nr:fumarylacetoacetate hydrolase family protein [Xinfangfangia sp. LG-4]MDR5654809.1 fumarylacetoacetate hydrolase family protein [Xinfangfangia sp. LG-4]